MAEVIALICGLYLFVAILVWVALFRKRELTEAPPLSSASVIICARDEEDDLPACLESLEAQQLTQQEARRVEVILVDDMSQDRTAQIMEQYARNSRYTVRVLRMPPPAPGEPLGKWRPLKEGMKLARGEGLLLTDADAVLPATWIQKHLRYLAQAPLVAGFARIERPGLWGLVQALDWLFLLGVGSSLNRLGVPQAALGKNLSVRRSTYQEVGGLEKIGFSLTEDLSLVQAVTRSGGALLFPLAPEMMVSNPGVDDWKEFVSQRMRWASGIKRLLPAGKLCIGTMAMRHFAVVVGVLVGEPMAFWGWGATALMNFLIQLQLTSKLNLKRRLWGFPLWEIFYTWTAPLLAAAFLIQRRVVWKGRRFARAEETP